LATSELGVGALLAGDSREYRLGNVLAEGGEGIVHFVRDRDDVVAKLYKDWEYGRDEKLRRMIDLSTKRLRRVAAWPLSKLSDDQDQMVGFVMESLDRWQPLHASYQIRTRLQHAPNRTWAYLLRISRNLATCVHHVHDHGFVIGDLNESNVLVGPDAMVKIIDADSFQLRTEDRLFPCKVGKPELLGPELQGRSLEGLERTPNHDLFALAALIFQALVFGRHPFAGVPQDDSDATLEDAIENGWYVFTRRRKVPLLPPPGLTIDWLPESVQELFERAFDPKEPARPTAREWFSALKEIENELGGCDVNGSHVFWKGNRRCPWCKLEERWNIILFRPAPLDPLSAADFDVEQVWSKIQSLALVEVENPPLPIDYRTLPPAPLTPYQRWLAKPLVQLSNWSFWLIYVAIIFGKDAMGLPLIFKLLFAAFSMLIVASSVAAERVRRKVRKANERLDHIAKEWSVKADPKLFDMRISDLNAVRRSLKSNMERYEAARQTRIRELHQNELNNYLRKYSVIAADVESQSRAKLGRLTDAGLNSAADLTQENLRRIHDQEGKFIRELTLWRTALTEQFWNASTYGLPPHEERAILERIHREDVAMRRELLAAETDLAELSAKLKENQAELAAQALPYQNIVREYGPTLAAYEPSK